MRIDLHTHSSVSDGTESPAELMASAAGADLDVVALTDHDTTGGWALAETARPPGLTVIPGMEMSCRWFPDDTPPSDPNRRLTVLVEHARSQARRTSIMTQGYLSSLLALGYRWGFSARRGRTSASPLLRGRALASRLGAGL